MICRYFLGTSRCTRATSVTSILSHHLAPGAAAAAFSDLTPNVNSNFTVSPNSNPFGIKVRDFHAKSVPSEFRSSIISPAAQEYAPSYEGNDGGIGDSKSVGSSGDGLAISELGIDLVGDSDQKLADGITIYSIAAEENTSKIKGTKICIAIRSFDNPQKQAWSLPAHTRNVAMPDTRTLYTVLRSPHIDKKSREQFEMRFKKRFLVIKAESHELSKKLFWLKRYRILGAQYELQFHCKTRLDMTHDPCAKAQ